MTLDFNWEKIDNLPEDLPYLIDTAFTREVLLKALDNLLNIDTTTYTNHLQDLHRRNLQSKSIYTPQFALNTFRARDYFIAVILNDQPLAEALQQVLLDMAMRTVYDSVPLNTIESEAYDTIQKRCAEKLKLALQTIFDKAIMPYIDDIIEVIGTSRKIEDTSHDD